LGEGNIVVAKILLENIAIRDQERQPAVELRGRAAELESHLERHTPTASGSAA